jgi:hypothetical protein
METATSLTIVGFFNVYMKQIALNGKHGKGKFALVDDGDYEELMKYRWHLHSRGYACTDLNKKRIYMHRLIMNPKKGYVIDHINHDKLDNRKCNLRTCTQSQNMMNSRVQKKTASIYKGVSFCKGKWMSRIVLNKKTIYLGVFDIELEAAEAYNAKANYLFEQYAHLNKI